MIAYFPLFAGFAECIGSIDRAEQRLERSLPNAVQSAGIFYAGVKGGKVTPCSYPAAARRVNWPEK
jgi:hypothetical protein